MLISLARILALASCIALAAGCSTPASEFCLDGTFDLAVRYQGLGPAGSEVVETSWCVVTEDDSDRVRFGARGKSNSDMEGSWEVAFLPPAVVRIVNEGPSPDIEFRNANMHDESLRHRRIDPRRLVEELESHPEWVLAATDAGPQRVRYPGSLADVVVHIAHGSLERLETTADLPLRGRVPVTWQWDWSETTRPRVEVQVDGVTLFTARGRWRSLDDAEATSFWREISNGEATQAPGDAWPARVDMQLETLVPGVHLVRGVRTGFHHLVVETAAGLIVGDAPAGWVELHQIPPADLVPGLGISGLSEQFIDFLRQQFPGRVVRAVALTHAHDDHAGGARAFAAAGAEVFAPAEVGDFLQAALNRQDMPSDRLSKAGGTVVVKKVAGDVTLDDPSHPVRLVSIGPGPHATASLGVHAVAHGVFFQSDLHVPNSAAEFPRADRRLTECWFARWAVRHLAPETIVIGSHSTIRTPVARLARYLAHQSCLH